MQCWICEREVDRFEPYGLPPRPGRCPHCGAKPRYRAVRWYLANVVRPRLRDGAEILEVGAGSLGCRYYPHPAVIGPARFTVIDRRRLEHHALLQPPHRFAPMDATALDFDDGTFDAILCNNVLPDIREDRAALAELRRCLRPDGVAMLETPWYPGRTETVAAYRKAHPELDDAYFQMNGIEWRYGEDLFDRFREAGFIPRTERLFADRDPAFHREHGLKQPTEVMLGYATETGMARFNPAA